MADKRSDEEKAKDAEKTLAYLSNIRSDYEDMVEESIKFVNHGRRRVKESPSNKGKKTGIDIYDGTAISAANMLRDGLCGYSVSKSFHWFDYSIPNILNFPRTSLMRAWNGKRMDEYPQVKGWLDISEEVVYSSFLRGNFYDIFPEAVGDAVSVGTVSVFSEEDVGSGRTIYTVPHFRECYVAENRFGIVDTNYRVYSLTLKSLAEKFGYDRMTEVDPSFEIAYKNNPYVEKEVIHATYPRSDYDPTLLNSKNKPWASIWVLRSPLKLLLEGGYDDMASITWRWRKNSDEIYGRSPAWDCIVDIYKANQQAKSNLGAGQRMVEPPLLVPEDLRGKLRDLPRGRTYMTNTDRNFPKPLVTGIQLPFAVDQQERTDKAIREHFHVDFFLMLSQAAADRVELTATQVIEMSAEKAAILGVRMGKMETEALNPIHDRQFNIEYRAGRIPRPPQILLDVGGKIEVDYLGPLAQAQKRVFKSQTIRAGIQSVGEMVAVYPQASLVIDPIKTTRDLLEAQGFPVSNFRSDEEIQQIMAIETKRARDRELVEAAPLLAKSSRLAATAPEEGSPLDLIMKEVE